MGNTKFVAKSEYTPEEFAEMYQVFDFPAFWKAINKEPLTEEEQEHLKIMKEFARVGGEALKNT